MTPEEKEQFRTERRERMKVEKDRDSWEYRSYTLCSELRKGIKKYREENQ